MCEGAEAARGGRAWRNEEKCVHPSGRKGRAMDGASTGGGATERVGEQDGAPSDALGRKKRRPSPLQPPCCPELAPADSPSPRAVPPRCRSAKPPSACALALVLAFVPLSLVVLARCVLQRGVLQVSLRVPAPGDALFEGGGRGANAEPVGGEKKDEFGAGGRKGRGASLEPARGGASARVQRERGREESAARREARGERAGRCVGEGYKRRTGRGQERRRMREGKRRARSAGRDAVPPRARTRFRAQALASLGASSGTALWLLPRRRRPRRGLRREGRVRRAAPPLRLRGGPPGGGRPAGVDLVT